MVTALVILSFVGFAISVFPLHVYNYLYINTEQKYMSLNIGIYGINIYNVNSVAGHPEEMQINGKSKKINAGIVKSNLYKIFNCLCLYKVIQLGDYGLQKNANAYLALAQHGISTALYKFIQINGNYCKLRNYTVFNEEHGYFRYYAKVVTIINMVVVAKILFILLMEKLDERKK